MAETYIGLLTFIVTGILFLSVTFGISKILRPNLPDAEKLSIYECGEEAISGGQIQFNSRFFVIALIFVLFEVELIFLFPWAIVFSNSQIVTKSSGLWLKIALIEMIVFVLILGLGLAYAWVKGHLDWIKPETKPTEIEYAIPMEAYDELRK